MTDASYCVQIRCWLCLDGGIYWTGERGIYCQCEVGQNSKTNIGLLANGRQQEAEQRIYRLVELEGVVLP